MLQPLEAGSSTKGLQAQAVPLFLKSIHRLAWCYMHSVQQVEACTLADKVKTALTDSTFSFTSCGINTFLALVLPVRAFEADTYGSSGQFGH